MKTKEVIYNLTGSAQVFRIVLTALLREVGISGEVSSGELPAEVLETLKVQLISPKATGVLVLSKNATKPCYYSVEGNVLTVHLSELVAGTHRLTIRSVYGTHTRSLLILDAIVPIETGQPGEPIQVGVDAVDTVSIVSGSDVQSLERRMSEAELAIAGKADGSIYRVGESGDPSVRDVAKVYAHSVELSNRAVAIGAYAVAEGESTTASGYASHAEGDSTTASGYASHAEGYKITASGYASHAEGESTTASGYASHAEGYSTIASGYASHAEGYSTIASEESSHAEGKSTTASGYASHAEGDSTTASGYASHAEGDSTIASGYASHAEGYSTTASGEVTHAEGDRTIASGDASHAEGSYTTASGYCQHVGGCYNVNDPGADPSRRGEFVFIIGNGNNDNNRSNAFAIKWDGTIVVWNNGTRVELTPAKLAQLVS